MWGGGGGGGGVDTNDWCITELSLECYIVNRSEGLNNVSLVNPVSPVDSASRLVFERSKVWFPGSEHSFTICR